ncbi:hypothetical protein Tco_0000106 [Tanacetum coccineum]
MELDNESKDRKVERDVERNGEPNILAPFDSDRELVHAIVMQIYLFFFSIFLRSSHTLKVVPYPDTFSSLVEHGSPQEANTSTSFSDRLAVPRGQRITGGSLVGMDVGLSHSLGSERWKKKKVKVLRLRKQKAEEEKRG